MVRLCFAATTAETDCARRSRRKASK